MTVPDYHTILVPTLAGFADDLVAAGFRVYVFRSSVRTIERGGQPNHIRHLGFSRNVNGRLCFASVSGQFGGYQFTMPIEPSRKHGSSMFIGGVQADEFDELTVETAELYASPTGRNLLVGTHENYPAGVLHLYTDVTNREG